MTGEVDFAPFLEAALMAEIEPEPAMDEGGLQGGFGWLVQIRDRRLRSGRHRLPIGPARRYRRPPHARARLLPGDR